MIIVPLEVNVESLIRDAKEATTKRIDIEDGTEFETLQAVIGTLASRLSQANRKLNTLVRFIEMTMEDGA